MVKNNRKIALVILDLVSSYFTLDDDFDSVDMDPDDKKNLVQKVVDILDNVVKV